MIGGHLGSRVSALLDGQLPPDEAERAWAHVHTCHACRDLVEREGWIKTQLAGLSLAGGGSSAPDHLKGSLRGPAAMVPPTGFPEPRRHTGMALLGGGAVGVAVVGVLALSLASPDDPGERRTPPANFRQTDTPSSVVTTPGAPGRTSR